MIRTIVVADSKLVGHALVDRLNDMPEIEVVAMLENAANSVVACAGRNIDLVLMDVCTLNDESGLEATSRIKRDSPSTKVIVMTSMPEYTFPEKARLAGADSFWYKDYGNSGLSDVVRRTLADESVWPENMPPVTLGLARSQELTARELDVLRELALGRSYEDIGKNLGVSLNTVKFHIRNLLAKTGFKTTLQLVVEAVDKRFVLPKY